MPNLSVIRSKLARRATVLKHDSVKIGWQANIINLQKNDSAISLGCGTIVKGELFTFAHGGRINIGEECYVGVGTRIWSALEIDIGNNVLMAHNISIMDSLTHPKDFLERREHFRAISQHGHPKNLDLDEKPIRIQNDAWIGAHSLVLRGVTIGERSIVAAGSVVVKNVPPDSIVAGNPARIVRRLDDTSE